MEIKRVSYTGVATDEVYRWLDHVVEEVVLQHIQSDAWNHVDLKASKYFGEQPMAISNDDGLRPV